MILTAAYHSQTQYYRYFTNNPSIKLIDPAYVAGDLNIEISVNNLYAYQSHQSFGQTIIYAFKHEQSSMIIE